MESKTQRKTYLIVGTIPIFNRKIVRNINEIDDAHDHRAAHIPGLFQAHQKSGRVTLVVGVK